MGLKRSDIIRLAVKEFVEERLRPIEVSPYQKVSHLRGVAESGVEDLGSGIANTSSEKPESLKMAIGFMKKYKNFPKDFADATLLCLAHNFKIRNITTFDSSHFPIYRLPGKQSSILLI